MKLFTKAKEYVNSASVNENLRHFERTVYWVKKIKPDADEALLIAAYAHDIQRAFRSKELFEKIEGSSSGFRNKEMLKAHQEDGSKIMSEFLKKEGADKKLIDRVAHLISKHEVGGDEDQNLLKDADSISFFETNAEYFVTKKAKEYGKEKVREKLDWMFERISSPDARNIAKPMYKSSIEKLNKITNN